MIHNFVHGNNSDRTSALDYLCAKKFKRVIDVGATMHGWSSEYLSHYVDILPWNNANVHGFIGNICLYSTWKPILEDVRRNGKYDFAICSHTLEDISSPQFVCEMLCEIANEGFIAVPSKCEELTRNINGPFYGHHHHRWIFNKEGNKFVGYPKLNFIEYTDWSDVKNDCSYNEIKFFWKDSFSLEIVNNDYMGPNCDSMYGYFRNLKND